MPVLRPLQRVAAYARVVDPSGAERLVGGIVRHGEPPREAAVREVAEQTGLAVEVTGLRSVDADVVDVPENGVSLHTIRLVYDAVPTGGDGPPRTQRTAAYAVLRAGDRVLLTHLTGSDGLWTLPGGGIDHGELPLDGLRREVYEETGLDLEPGDLLDVTSRHFVGRAPNGRLEDFHGIRLIFSGTVRADVEPRVVEVDGTTDRVAWVGPAELAGLRVTDVVRTGLGLSDGD